MARHTPEFLKSFIVCRSRPYWHPLRPNTRHPPRPPSSGPESQRPTASPCYASTLAFDGRLTPPPSRPRLCASPSPALLLSLVETIDPTMASPARHHRPSLRRLRFHDSSDHAPAPPPAAPVPVSRRLRPVSNSRSRRLLSV